MRLHRSNFRDRRNYVAALVSEMAAPVLRRWARSVSHEDPTAPTRWRTGLIVGHGHMGDVLYRTCSLDALAERLPTCRWSYLTTQIGAGILQGNPAISEILPWMGGSGPDSVTKDRLAVLRARSYDVILCTESVRHHTALRLALRLGIPNRVAFVHKGLSGLVTHPIQLPHPMSRPAQFREMVAQITGATIDGPLRPRVYPSAADRRAAAIEWQRLGYTDASTDASLVIACALTTRQPVGHIPTPFFVNVLRALVEQAPHAQIVLCGTLEDGTFLRIAADAIGANAKLSAGHLSVLAYAAFLERCQAFLGLDSGPRHLANAVGIPVTFVRNLGTSAIETGHYAPNEWDAAPDGEFLSDAEIVVRLQRVNPADVAHRILTTTRGHAAP